MSGLTLAPGETDTFRIVQATRQLMEGRSNAIGRCTLAMGVTSTVVLAPNCSTTSVVFLFQQTANAAAVIATTYVPQATIIKGQFTIIHAVTANPDCTFAFEARG